MASDRNRTLDTLLLLLHSYQHVRPLSQSSCLPRPPLRKIQEESSKFDVALLQLDHLDVARIIININIIYYYYILDHLVVARIIINIIYYYYIIDHLGVAGLLLTLLQPVLVLLDRHEPLGPAQLGVKKCFMLT